MNKFQQLRRLGQSLWLDFIRRSYITSGELERLVAQGLAGVTSNPSIFEKAIAGSQDYDETLATLARQGKSTMEIYEALALEDIRLAAKVLLPLYEQSQALDGYVSLEVNPHLAYDSQATLVEAQRLFRLAARPNVMIKIPATRPGIAAIEEAIRLGINVNVTLIFSLEHYRAAAEAYLRGLERRAASGEEVANVASVASFFVSRIDTRVDELLATRGDTRLQGKAAIASAKVAYQCFLETFRGERWERLAQRGARVQRPLWASTSTKNPAYEDTLYVDHLIGAHTVNTLPPHTLEAFLDHGTVANTLERGVEEARIHLRRMAEAGIDLDAVTEQLQIEGVDAFRRSFDALLDSMARKCAALKMPHASQS